MPSPGHAADVERVLERAAREWDTGGAWFGPGLPQALKTAMEVAGRTIVSTSAEIAFVDASEATTSRPPGQARYIVALSDTGLDRLSSVIETVMAAAYPIARLVCPLAVFDLGREGLRVREIQRGLTAADLQAELSATLWSGPDLKELQ